LSITYQPNDPFEAIYKKPGFSDYATKFSDKKMFFGVKYPSLP